MRFESRLSILPIFAVSLFFLFDFRLEGAELAYNQVVLEPQPDQMIEHSFRARAVRGAPVSANALSDGAVYQTLLSDFVEYQVEGFVNRLSDDALCPKLSAPDGLARPRAGSNASSRSCERSDCRSHNQAL